MMSDSTESAARALRTLKNESGNSLGCSSRQLLNAKVERSPSPDQTCPICLGDITNKAVTNSCLHQFCFFCLCEWAKVKAECPLCKQKFNIIFHTIKSMADYQEYRVDQPLPDAHSDPHIFINVAVQGATRFGYRTTMGLERRSPMMVLSPMGPMGPMALQAHPPFPTHSGVTTRSVSTARAQRGGIEFRRNIYRQNLWVRPSSSQQRIRASSPEFYRLNPAQMHRLVPWLMRELAVLLDGSVFFPETACGEILDWITMFPINSSDFKRVAHHYFGNKTDHFVHEFYHFASSPHDMPSYDQMARYTPSNADLEIRGASDDRTDNAEDFSFNIPDATQLLSPIRLDSVTSSDVSDTFNSFRLSVDGSVRYIREAMGSSSRDAGALNFSSRVAANLLVPPTPTRPIEVIVLSSDEENVNSSNIGDTDVEIQLITLDSDSDNDVIEIKPPTPALIEITDGTDDSPCPSPLPPPPAFDAAGPSTTDASVSGDRKRSARFFRPWYREYSSSSEEDISSKKRPLRKKSSSKRPSRSLLKRSRTAKSSRYVSSSSSSSSSSSTSSSNCDSSFSSDSEVEIEEINVWKVKRKSSNGCISLCRDSRNEGSKSKRSRKRHLIEEEDDRGGRSPKKAKRKLSGGGSGTREDECSKCCRRLKKQLSSSNSEVKRSKSSKRKRRRSYRSSSSSIEEIKMILNTAVPTANTADTTSSSPMDESPFPSGESVFGLPGNFARNPKALSKKAIILNKRNSELSAQNELVYPYRQQESNMNGAMESIIIDLLPSPKHESSSQYAGRKLVNVIPQLCQPSTSSGSISANRPVAVVEYSSDSESSSLSIGKEYVPIERDNSSVMSNGHILRETAIMFDYLQDNGDHAKESSTNNYDILQGKNVESSSWDLKSPNDSKKVETLSSIFSNSSKSSPEVKVNQLEVPLNGSKVNSWRRTKSLLNTDLDTIRTNPGKLNNGNNCSENSSLQPAPRIQVVSSPIMSSKQSPLTTPSNSNTSSPSHSSISTSSIRRLKSVVVRPVSSSQSKTNADCSSHSRTFSEGLSDN